MYTHLRFGPGLSKAVEEHIARPVVITVNEFDDATCKRFAEEVGRAHETGQPVIPIVVDSFGGDPYALLGMLAIVDASTVPVVTVCEAKAMSCGAFLFAAGSARYAAPTATFMLHDVSTEVSGKLQDVKADANETQRLSDLLMTRMATDCGKPKTYFQRLLLTHNHTDIFWSGREAKRHGLVTHLSVPSFTTTVAVTHAFGS